MTRPRVLDLYCCQGAAGHGYTLAGYEIVMSVDLTSQPHNPHPFTRSDAVKFMQENTTWIRDNVDLIHASPPCQRKTLAGRVRQNEHPALIAPTREMLRYIGLPYIIENVVADPAIIDDDPLIDPIVLCGAMFPPLRTYRHREFESNLTLVAPPHPRHLAREVKMGRPLKDGDWYFAVGNFSNVPYVRANMGVPWMTRDGIRECIPPAYTEYLGRQVKGQL
jgi:DNA (cytosine-5)-methyltransferase 1